MPESETHMNYVKQAERFAKTILPEEYQPYLLVDTPSSSELPPKLLNEAFKPDLYLHHNDWHLIGEAKTDSDCMRKHSIQQYETYFKELDSFGKSNSLLILSCSISVSSSMSNLLQRMKRQHSYHCSVYIINELGTYKKF